MWKWLEEALASERVCGGGSGASAALLSQTLQTMLRLPGSSQSRTSKRISERTETGYAVACSRTGMVSLPHSLCTSIRRISVECRHFGIAPRTCRLYSDRPRAPPFPPPKGNSPRAALHRRLPNAAATASPGSSAGDSPCPRQRTSLLLPGP